jgi:DNA-binding SARP family transcriptional activator/ABC-type branched-subunit amino acid transport system substrate-binding protein
VALEFRILGPLEVVDCGRELPLGGAKQRALLAILLVHANEPVSVDVLSDALWDGEPPPTAVKMIQGYVSQLRKVLGDGVLVTRTPGYLARVDVDELDASRFERLVANAAGRPPDDAAALLDAALRLWRGAPLADFAYEAFAQTEIARLEEARLGALEERIDADLARGRHAGVVSELEALVAEHPFRERLLAQLMLALYRCGRQADALEAYRVARHTLDRELGLEPSPDLRELEQQILVHDAALQAPPRRLAVPPRIARHGRRIAIAGALVVAAAAAAAGWELAGGAGGHTAAAMASAIVVIDPQTGNVVRRIQMAQTPTSLAVGAGSVWALSTADRTISRIDPVTRKVIDTFTTVGIPTDLAVGAGALWVENGRPTSSSALIGIVVPYSVSRLDLRSAVPTRVITLPAAASYATAGFSRSTGSSAMGIGRDAVWAIDANGNVARIAPSTRTVVATVTGLDVQAIGVSGGDVWVDDGATMLARIDPRTNRITTRIPLPAGELDGIAIGAGAVWVADEQDGTVWRVVPGPHPVTRTISVGIGVVSLSFGDGALWAANPFLGTISRIDPVTYAVRTVDVGGTPQALAVGSGGVWTSVNAPATGPKEDGVQALPEPSCSDVVSGGRHVQFLIASDLPLRGSAAATLPMTRAIAFVLQRHGFHAGKYAVGYQSCDDSTAQSGNFDFAACGANARAYAADKDVLGVIGTFDSDCAIAELPITSAASSGPLAMISPLDTYPDLTHRAQAYTRGLLGLLYPTGRRNFVRIIAPDDVQAAADAQLADELGLARVYVLDDESDYGRNLTGGFVHAARKLGLKLAGVSPWSGQAKSYAALVGRIQRSRADGVFLAGYFVEPGTGVLLHELRVRLGLRVKLIAPDGFDQIPTLVHEAGADANGMYVSFAGRPNERLPAAGRAFIDAFALTQPSAHVTSYSAAYAAQAAEVLLDAIARSDGTRASVTKELFATKVSDGILGSFGFTLEGDMTPSPVTIFRVVGGNRPSSTYERDFAGAVVDRVVDVPAALAR